MTIDKLKSALEESFSAETCQGSKEQWTSKNPAYGHCALAALIVNDFLGGKIIWANAKYPDGKVVSHYYNLINGKVTDLTKFQFPLGVQIIPRDVNIDVRANLLSYDDNVRKYRLLKRKVEKIIDKKTP